MAQLNKTSVFLDEIRVRKDGTVFMRATWGFLNSVRTRAGSPAGVHLRIGTFDFYETRKGIFIGVPDEHGPEALAEAARCASYIVAIYRSILLFEQVFAEPGSYNSWIVFNRRAPTPRDLSEIARQHGLHIPYMMLPFKRQKPNLIALLQKAVTSNPRPPIRKVSVPPKTCTYRPASREALQNLASAFARR